MNEEIKDLVLKIQTEKDPISKAKLINFLNKEKQVRIKDIARLLEVSSSYICNLLRLLKLPDSVVDGYYSKNLSLTHLMTISRLHTQEDILSVYEKILQAGLTVGAVQELVTQALSGIDHAGEKIKKEISDKIKNRFKSITQEIKVEVIQTRVQAKVRLTLKGNRQKTTKFLEELAD